MRHNIRIAATVTAMLALAACNPFRREPVVQMSMDENANERWNGTLSTPPSLAGAVQIRGSAAMTPAAEGGNTYVRVSVQNAAPGGNHPWSLRRGHCGADDGLFGSADAYRAIKVQDDGRGEQSTTIPGTMPLSGRYHVSVSASEANAETIIACGNLAPPSR